MADVNEGGEVQEPENSTVDDWFGQNVARDQEVADRAAAENDTEQAAQEQFDAEAEGEQRYDEGHPRPDDAGADGDSDVVGDPA